MTAPGGRRSPDLATSGLVAPPLTLPPVAHGFERLARLRERRDAARQAGSVASRPTRSGGPDGAPDVSAANPWGRDEPSAGRHCQRTEPPDPG